MSTNRTAVLTCKCEPELVDAVGVVSEHTRLSRSRLAGAFNRLALQLLRDGHLSIEEVSTNDFRGVLPHLIYEVSGREYRVEV